LFLPLPPSLASQYPSLAPEDDSPPHITLLYVGEVPKAKEELFVSTVMNVLANEPSPILASLDEVDHFVHPHQNRQVFYSRVRFSRDVAELRDRVWLALEEAGFAVKHSFPLAFFPHVTLGYIEDAGAKFVWTGVTPQGMWDIRSVAVWGISKPVEIALGTYKPESLPLPLKTAKQRVASNWLARQAKSPSQAQLQYVKVLVQQALRGGWLTPAEVPSNEMLAVMDDLAVSDLIDMLKRKKPFSVTQYGNGQFTVHPKQAREDKVPGGLGDKKKPSDFDPKQIAKGKKIEMEHTDDPALAEEIAMDHLTEDPAYYDKLDKIEKHARFS
jgi:2'-5' RNA ligase